MKIMPEMGWAIVYIRGTEGFQEEVLPRLRDKYLSGDLETDDLMMVWIPGIGKLRGLKIAIGSRTILRYRLQFSASVSPSIKTFTKSPVEITSTQPEAANQMTVWQNRRFEEPEMLTE